MRCSGFLVRPKQLFTQNIKTVEDEFEERM